METIPLSKPHKQTKHDLTIPTYIEYEKKKKRKIISHTKCRALTMFAVYKDGRKGALTSLSYSNRSYRYVPCMSGVNKSQSPVALISLCITKKIQIMLQFYLNYFF